MLTFLCIGNEWTVQNVKVKQIQMNLLKTHQNSSDVRGDRLIRQFFFRPKYLKSCMPFGTSKLFNLKKLKMTVFFSLFLQIFIFCLPLQAWAGEGGRVRGWKNRRTNTVVVRGWVSFGYYRFFQDSAYQNFHDTFKSKV